MERTQSHTEEAKITNEPKTGADLLVESLINEGVDTLFGYPGGAVLPIFDALYKAKGSFHQILARHEQGPSMLLKVMHVFPENQELSLQLQDPGLLT